MKSQRIEYTNITKSEESANRDLAINYLQSHMDTVWGYSGNDGVVKFITKINSLRDDKSVYAVSSLIPFLDDQNRNGSGGSIYSFMLKRYDKYEDFEDEVEMIFVRDSEILTVGFTLLEYRVILSYLIIYATETLGVTLPESLLKRNFSEDSVLLKKERTNKET
jgi:hypothetical protein